MRPGVTLDIFPALLPGGGIGRYARDLAFALGCHPGAPPATFVYPRNLRGAARRIYPQATLHELPLPSKLLHLLFILGARLEWRFDALYGHPELVHSPVGYGPLFAAARLIVNVHDLTYLEHPDWHPWRTGLYFGQAIPAAARRATAVICHSEWVRRRAIQVLGLDPRRAVTLPPPLGHGFHPMPPADARAHAASRFGLDRDFILHVGTLEPRKNHVGLVAAFERLRQAGFPGPLVLVGQEGWHVGPILSRLERSSERHAILRVLDADDRDLVALYGACTLCAFPSLEEGFGMPLLESMACGAACVTSDHAALLELGQGCALAVPATDTEALAGAMARLWRDAEERARLSAQGPQRAAAYAFERWAGRIFSLYRSVLDGAPLPGVVAGDVGPSSRPVVP